MDPFDIVVLSLRMAQATAAVVLNSLTLMCTFHDNSPRTTAGILIGNLAFSDLLHGLVMLVRLPLKNIYAAVCIYGLSIKLIAVYAQLITLILLVIERWRSLRFVLNRGRNFSRATIVILLCFAWMAIIIERVISTVISASTEDQHKGKCLEKKDIFPLYSNQISYWLFVGSGVIVLAFYIAIGCISCSWHHQTMPGTMNNFQQMQRRRRDLRITRMIGMVIGLFYVLNIPPFLAYRYIDNMSPSSWKHMLNKIAYMINDVNFWINPIIYAWRNKEFKRAFAKLFNCGGQPNLNLRQNSVQPINAVPINIPEGPGQRVPATLDIINLAQAPARNTLGTFDTVNSVAVPETSGHVRERGQHKPKSGTQEVTLVVRSSAV